MIEIQTCDSVDLKKYCNAKWIEVARINFYWEDENVVFATANYEFDNGRIMIENSAFDTDNNPTSKEAVPFSVKRGQGRIGVSSSKLRVSFGCCIEADYWILDVGYLEMDKDDKLTRSNKVNKKRYDYAVVCTPLNATTIKCFWILMHKNFVNRDGLDKFVANIIHTYKRHFQKKKNWTFYQKY